MPSITSALQIANELSSMLGLDSWQIKTGTYNGVAFHIIPSVTNKLNRQLNPASGIINATNNLIGNSTLDSNNLTLPYGTYGTSLNISDSCSLKTVVHRIPNNPNVFELMGTNGEVFTIEGIIWGSAYSNAIGNLFKTMLNPSSVPNKVRYVLVHPIWGTIPNVYLLSYKRIHNPKLWRACMYQFTFESTQPIGFTNSNSQPNDLTSISNNISSILNICNGLNNTWNTTNFIINTYGTQKNYTNVKDTLKNIQTSILNTTNVSLNITKLLVDNLKPEGYNNVALNNTVTSPTTNIPSLYYFNNNMTPTDVNTILSYNNDIIQASIADLNTINVNTIYDSITNLVSLQSQLSALSLSLLNGYYGTTRQFIVPYDSNLFDICFLNNLDYDTQSNTILQLNKSIIYSTNYIVKGTNLLLPIPTNNNTGAI